MPSLLVAGGDDRGAVPDLPHLAGRAAAGRAAGDLTMGPFADLMQGFVAAADADEPADVLRRRAARPDHRRAARHRPVGGDRAAAAADLRREPDRRRSSCSPASTTARNTAARSPRCWSTCRASRRSVMTSIDGYQMALQGRGGVALGIAAIGSFIAGTLGTLGLMLLAPPLAQRRAGLRPAGILHAGAARPDRAGRGRRLGAEGPRRPASPACCSAPSASIRRSACRASISASSGCSTASTSSC